MIDKVDYSKCTLCKVCANVCPKGCIKFNYEKDTFLYPVINFTECIKCNLCEIICPILNNNKKKSMRKIYAAKANNNDIRINSSSGGVFTILALNILEQNGVVFGAAFDNDFNVRHIPIEKEENLFMIQRSKYIQSNMNNIYNEVYNNLEMDKKVLFSGSSCQVAALRNYLKKEYDNLILVDFICHGVPSYKVFREYIKILEKKYKSVAKEINFRDKSKGWKNRSLKILFENRKCYSEQWEYETYMQGYLKNMYLKESCYKCNFKNMTSGSDITLGDYWGSEIFDEEIDDDKGLSLVITNSARGAKLFNHTKELLFTKEINLDEATKYNQHLYKSSEINPNRDNFLNYFKKGLYKKAFDKFCRINTAIKVKKLLRKKLGKIKSKII